MTAQPQVAPSAADLQAQVAYLQGQVAAYQSQATLAPSQQAGAPLVSSMSANDPYPRIMQHKPDAGSDAIQKLMDVIEHMAHHGISDVHIHPDAKARWVRNDALELLPEDHPLDKFTEVEILLWLSWATGDNPDPLEDRGHAKVAIEGDRARLRGAFRRSAQGYTVTFRLIPGSVPNANSVGVPKIIQDLTKRKSGLVLVEGPTGSGKTTLIASLLHKVNHESDRHIYTIEEPIEFLHQPAGNTSIVQREIGLHAASYPLAIEDALRSKPNVILIGEILNADTAKAALHAATTGHLVFATAHAGSVVEALNSYIGQFVANEQPQIRARLASSLLAVVVQRLIPTIPDPVTGLTKLAAAREVMVSNRNFSEMIREIKTEMIDQQLGGNNAGSNTMESSVARLYAAGIISKESAYENCNSPEELERDIATVVAARLAKGEPVPTEEDPEAAAELRGGRRRG